MAKPRRDAWVELRMRLAASDGEPIGPGKIALLETIGETGSISAAARRHDMSYGRAWKLVAAVNAVFVEPVVLTSTGGHAGGGASLSAFAVALIAAYRAAEANAQDAAARELSPYLASLAKASRRGRRSGSSSRVPRR